MSLALTARTGSHVPALPSPHTFQKHENSNSDQPTTEGEVFVLPRRKPDGLLRDGVQTGQAFLASPAGRPAEGPEQVASPGPYLAVWQPGRKEEGGGSWVWQLLPTLAGAT